MHRDIHARALKHAAQILGGEEPLRQYLAAWHWDITTWDGKAELPSNIFLRLVDVITREETRKR